MKLKPGATWTDKVSANKVHEIKINDKTFADVPAGATMLIATPKIVEHYVRQIPPGHSVTTAELRADLAREYGAEHTCPLTTGIFLRLVAEAAFEQHQRGAALEDIAPFWRVISPKSTLAKKLSFGTAFIEELQRQEEIEK
jgi:hypothetical protein